MAELHLVRHRRLAAAVTVSGPRLRQVKLAVDFIAGDEGGTVQQGAGQLRPTGEQHLLRDPGRLAVLLIRGTRPGQVQRPAYQRVPAAGGVGHGDRDLAQRDTARRAAILAGCANASAEDFSSAVSSTISTASPSSR